MNGTAESYFQSTYTNFAAAKSSKERGMSGAVLQELCRWCRIVKRHPLTLLPELTTGLRLWILLSVAYRRVSCSGLLCVEIVLIEFHESSSEQERPATCCVSATLESRSQACWHVPVLRTGSPAKVTSWEAQAAEDRRVTSTGSLRHDLYSAPLLAISFRC